jgi:hypothetical protein
MAQLRHPCRAVVPISLYTIPGDLHRVLRRYKDARGSRQQIRDREAIAELVAGFLRRHQACLAAGGEPYDLLTTVPSTQGRLGPHPLTRAVRTDPWLSAHHQELLVRGPASLGHARASDLGFLPCRAVDGARIVVLDDTWTTGARAQSAASALQSHGARVIAIVVVGRLVHPGHSPVALKWWRDQAARRFSVDRCCLEACCLEPSLARGVDHSQVDGDKQSREVRGGAPQA